MKRTIVVDYNDPSDLKKVISKLQKRRKLVLRELGYDEVKFHGSKFNMGALYPLMEGIYNTDLSSIYNKVDTTTSNYYVYVHCNPFIPIDVRRDIRHYFLAVNFGLAYEPFYVGKGVGDRWRDLNRNDSHRKIRGKILSQNQDIISIKVVENITESKALEIESKLIDLLGLKALTSEGLLVNLDEGENPNNRRNLYPKHKYLNKYLKRNGFKISK